MKILAAGMEWVDQVPGGLNQYYADYLKAMLDFGHTVEGLVTGAGGPVQAPSYISDVTAGQRNAATYRRMRAFRREVRGRTPAFRPDVFNPHFALYASLVTRNIVPSHIPIVTHFQGPWSLESRVEEQGHPLKKYVRYRLKKQIELTAYRRSDAFIVLSRHFRDVLSAEFGLSPERIHVVPAAVDIERFQPVADRMALRSVLGLPADANVLFCARRLARRMGIDNLIRAMVPVVRKVPNTVLYIAGEGALREELERLVEDCGLQRSVRLLGRVSSGDLVRWYQAADLGIVPTITLEGFGLVTAEALACGTPVLGTPYGGTKEILERFAPELLFADKTPESMADKIVSVLKGATAVPSRAECRRHVLNHYTWDKVASRLTGVFELAIATRKEFLRK